MALCGGKSVWIALVTAAVFVQVAQARTPTRFGAEYLIDTWTSEDGLPENSATAMVQDAKGYLWFGTFGGLVRFDGVNFTRFDTFNTPGMPDSQVVNLYLDRAGRMWVSTVGGLVVRDDTGWHSPGSVGDFVRTFVERSNGDLLLTTFNGALWEWHGGKLTEMAQPLPPGDRGKGYFGYVDEDGKWWAVRGDFVGYWDGMKWERALGAEVEGMGCCAARDGGMWLLERRSLRKFKSGRPVSQVALSEELAPAWGMSEDGEGNVWVSMTETGVCRISPSGRVMRMTTGNGLSAGSARFVFEDAERDLWVGTNGGGLQRLKKRRFGAIGTEEGLPDRVVHAVSAGPDGMVLAATYGGGVFRVNGGKAERLPGWAGIGYLQSVLADQSGRIWVGTYGQGLWIIDRGKARGIARELSGGDNVVALFEDSRGRVWIDGGHGVAVCDAGNFRVLRKHPGGAGDASVFAEGTGGTVWAANRKGVFRVDQGEFVELKDGGAPLRNVMAMYGDSDGGLWMAADHGDLMCYRSGNLSRVKAVEGLPVGAIRGMVEDAHGYLWMTSSSGIFRVSRRDLIERAAGRAGPVTVNWFNGEDGLVSTDFTNGTQPVCSRAKDGRLYFATGKGVATVDPEHLWLDVTPPRMEVEGLVYQGPGRGRGVGGEVIRLEGARAGGTKLAAGSRWVEIDFAALCMAAPSKVRYQVKLDPIDGEWQDAGNQRTITYRDPEPGEYVFRVRAANDDGVWNLEGTAVPFVVRPYYWQTGWFRAGVALCLVGIGAGAAVWVLRARHRRETEARRQREELAHLSRVATLGELSGSLAHELNQPLAAILSNAQAAQRFLSREPLDVREVREILKDIIESDRRAGQIIQRLRALLKKGEVQSQPLDMNELVGEVLRLVRTELDHQGVSVETDLEAGLPRVLGDRVQLQQVVLNLVMNASEAVAGNVNGDKLVVVRTRRTEDGSVKTSVIDRGHGIEPEKLEKVFEPFFTTKSHGMGMGLAVCRSIVTAHRGTLSATNNAHRGATFEMVLEQAGGKQ